MYDKIRHKQRVHLKSVIRVADQYGCNIPSAWVNGVISTYGLTSFVARLGGFDQ